MKLKIELLKNLSYNGVNILLNFGSSILVARFMGASAIGIIGFSYAFVLLFEGLYVGGFGNAYISMFHDKKHTVEQINGAYVLVMTLSKIVAILVLAMLGWFSGYFDDPQKQIVAVVLAIFLLQSLFNTYNTYSAAYFSSVIDQSKSNQPAFIQNLVTQSGRILTALFWGSVIGLALSQFLGVIIAIFISHHFIRQKTQLKRPGKKVLKEFITTGGSFFTFSLTQNLPKTMDKVFLGLFMDFRLLGIYTIAKRVGETLQALLNSTGVVFFPFLKSQIVHNNVSIIDKFIKKYFAFVGLIVIPVLGLFVIFSRDILQFVFGEMFISGSLILKLSVVFVALSALRMPYANIIVSKLKMKLANSLNFIFLAVLIGIFLGMYVLLKPEGIVIAEYYVFALALGGFVSLLLFYFYSYRIYSFIKNAKIYSDVIVSIIMVTLITVFIRQFVSGTGLYKILYEGVIYIALFAILSYVKKNKIRDLIKSDFGEAGDGSLE